MFLWYDVKVHYMQNNRKERDSKLLQTKTKLKQ